MANLDSVLLSYKNSNRIEYQVCAEFLRLMGLFVCEDVEEERGINGLEWDKLEFNHYYVIEELLTSQTKTQSMDDKITLLCDALIAKENDKEEKQVLEDIKKIYCQNQLLLSSVTLQYYYGMGTNEIVAAGKHFENAADDFVSLIQHKPDYINNTKVCYAKLFCKQKANLARFWCKQPVVYYVNDLATEGLSMIDRFPEFASAWVLLGLVYEESKNRWRDAIDAFQQAIVRVGEQPFTSSIYYWLGRRYGGFETHRKEAEVAYQHAYFLMKKYRNIYKVATAWMNQENWEKALFYFKECLQFLNQKEGYWDPLEQEYYFKVNIHIGYVYLMKGDFYQAIQFVNDALELRANIAEGKKEKNSYVRFYTEIYQKDAGAYIDMSISRMSPQQAYRYLEMAYRKLNMAEIAKYYWNLMEH